MKIDVLEGVVGFEWDEANIAHIARHDVAPEEAEEIFFDINNILNKDVEHSVVEKRFLIIGKTEKGRVLYQIFTKKGNKIRVVSSRDINRKEVGLYEKKARRSKVQK